MSNLTPFNYFNATTSTSITPNTIRLNAGLIDETLNIISPCYLGPAFVPKVITGLNDSVSIGNKQTSVISSVNNSLGTSRQNKLGHLFDQFSYYTPNYGHKTISLWHQNGGTNSVHTRILGIGNGIEDPITGKNQYSGFRTDNSISRGTLNHTTSEYNRFANVGGDNGTTNFLCNRFSTKDKLNLFGQNLFDEFGINEQYYFMNNCFFTAEGISSIITDIGNITIDNFNSGKFVFDLSKTSLANKFQNITKKFNLYFKGTKIDKNKKIIIDNNIIQKFNINILTLRENSHSLWFYNNSLLSLDNSNFGANFLLVFKKDENNQSQLDYNSFEDKFQTAKTPWITSQPIDRSGFSDLSRDKIHEKVKNLFRFHSLDDGEVGNRFRIKINPTHKGSFSQNKKTLEYSKFDIFFMQYDPRDNSYELLESYSGVNLDSNDENYICRQIGTKHRYFDFNNNKVVETGIYENKSKYLRVEVTDEIEFKQNPFNLFKLMPTGFRSYPNIKIHNASFNNYGNNLNGLNIIQTPLEYVYYKNTNLDLCSGISNHWGVQFRTTKKENDKKLSDKYQEEKIDSKVVVNKDKPLDFSPHYFYTRYFSHNRKDNKNIWIEDDTFCNSYFNLEKICYKLNDDQFILDDTIYLRSGVINNTKNSGLYSNNSTSYKFINFDDDSLYVDIGNSFNTKYQNKLSFDLFTYGGFDGTNYLDQDKRYLNNDALIREMNGEFEGSEINGPTVTAYSKAIDIATNYENCNCDIFTIPGMTNIKLHEKIINIAEEQRRFIYLGDISGYSENNLIQYNYNESFTVNNILNILPYYYGISSKGVMKNNFNILSETIDINRYRLDIEEYITDIDNVLVNYKSNTNLPDYSSYVESIYNLQLDYLDNQFSSRYFMPLYGGLTETDNNIISHIPVESVVSYLFLLNQFSAGIINSNITQFTNLFKVSEGFKEQVNTMMSELGINYFNNNGSNLQLISEHSSYSIRDSIFREIVYVRIINIIKKLVKFNIFIDSRFIDGGVLFNNNSKYKNVYQKFEIQMRNLYDSMVSVGLLTAYVLKLPESFDNIQIKKDMENYILRGSVILKLTNKSDNNIINLELDEVLSDLSLISNQLNYNDTGIFLI